VSLRILEDARDRGEVRVRPDTVDDLWHLSHVIRPGDIAVAKTWRTPEEATRDKLRAGKVEKQAMTIAIRVEEVELQADHGRLRLLGVIVEGPQEHGSHHTLNVESLTELTIRKERWTTSETERLVEAVEASKRPILTLVAIEGDEATVAHLRPMGLAKVAEVTGHIPGKQFGHDAAEAKRAFYGEVWDVVERHRAGGPLLVAGPGFWKDEFVEAGKKVAPEGAKAARVEPVGHGGMAGIHEAIRRGAAERFEAEQRAAQEIRSVEGFLEALGQDAPSTYGPDHVRAALEAGAVAELVLNDDLPREDFERFLDLARSVRAECVVVNAKSEVGRKLAALGGAGARLRYAWTPPF
jgi:protein pelota